MQVEAHTAAEFSGAIRALMPPGDAWQWPAVGSTESLGAALMDGPANELARVDAQVPALLDLAIEQHTPKLMRWTLADYQAVADASQSDVAAEVIPRRPFVAGSYAGQRLWSGAGATFPVPLVNVRKCRPFAAGSKAGDRVWSHRARYVLLVNYYATAADLDALHAALAAFKQSHMVLFFIDVTERGGEFVDA